MKAKANSKIEDPLGKETSGNILKNTSGTERTSRIHHTILQFYKNGPKISILLFTDRRLDFFLFF